MSSRKEMHWFWRGGVFGAAFGISFLVTAVVAAIINPLPYIFQNGTTADATQVNADLSQIVSNVNSNAVPIVGGSTVPTGAVVPFNLSSCPSGWLPLDGISATPDMRGYFVRGLDTGGSVDPGRTLATLQQDQFQNHAHGVAGGTLGGTSAGTSGGSGTNTPTGTSGIIVGGASSGNPGSETRPKNVSLLYCVKS
jgi:hypothetical protein